MKTRHAVGAIAGLVGLFCSGVLHGQERHPIRRLTFHPAQEGFPTWAPDGKTIVYSFFTRGDSTWLTGLWKTPTAGGGPKQFTQEIGEHPAWSPDGHYIVFDADSGNSIKLVSSRGGKPVRIVHESIPVFRGGNPNWSPDGSRVVFKAGSKLWVLDVGTGEAVVAFSKEGTYPIPGCWSRDGDHIYVTVRGVESYEANIWRVSSRGSEQQQLTFGEGRRLRYMDLSPDGSLLVFVECEERNCDLWAMPAEGGNAVQLTFHPAYDDTPRWSPDGTQIAFTSTRAESFDVWIMEPDLGEIRAALAAINR